MNIPIITLNTGATLVPSLPWSGWLCLSKIKDISRLALSIFAISSCISSARGVGMTSLEQMEIESPETGFRLEFLKNQERFDQWMTLVFGNMKNHQLAPKDFELLSPWKTDFHWTWGEIDSLEMDKSCLAAWQNSKDRYLRVDEVSSNDIRYYIHMATQAETRLVLKTNGTLRAELMGDNWDDRFNSRGGNRKSEERFGIMRMLPKDEMNKKTKCLYSPFCASWKEFVAKIKEEYWKYWNSLEGLYEKQLYQSSRISKRVALIYVFPEKLQSVEIRRLERELDRVGPPWGRSSEFYYRDITEIINQYADLLSSRIATQLNTALLDMIERGDLVFYIPISKRPVSVHEKNSIDRIHSNGTQQITYGVYIEESLRNRIQTFDLNTLRNKLRDLEKVPYERAALKPFSSWVKWVDAITYITGVVASITAYKCCKRGYLLLKID